MEIRNCKSFTKYKNYYEVNLCQLLPKKRTVIQRHVWNEIMVDV